MIIAIIAHYLMLIYEFLQKANALAFSTALKLNYVILELLNF